jgi:hypothetical protein
LGEGNSLGTDNLKDPTVALLFCNNKKKKKKKKNLTVLEQVEIAILENLEEMAKNTRNCQELQKFLVTEHSVVG